MTVSGRLELVAFDAPNIDRIASFYAELAGWEIARRESDWITLRAGDGQEVAFQLAPDHVAPQWPGQERPQQFHLDLQVDGTEAAAERAVGLGATRLPKARAGSRCRIQPATRSTCVRRTALDPSCSCSQ